VTPVLRFAQWLQYTDWAAALRYSAQVYPLVLSLHLVGIAFFGGMILFTDLRLLGLAMRRLPILKVVGALRVPKHIGITIVAACGIAMASSKAEEYYYNWFFWTKMSLLALICVHGLAFRRSVYRNTQEPAPSQAKLAGALSLILWTSVMICGRGIGYIEPPLQKLHALLWFKMVGVAAPWLTRICAWL
jgi:hypothetical protein